MNVTKKERTKLEAMLHSYSATHGVVGICKTVATNCGPLCTSGCYGNCSGSCQTGCLGGCSLTCSGSCRTGLS